MTPIDLCLAAGKTIIIFMMILNLIPVLIWMERKGAAYIQDRRGPNRASILGIRLGGLIHSLADAVKLLTKHDITGSAVYRPLFIMAPMVALFIASITMAVIPFAEPLTIGSITFTLQIADLRAGLLYVFAFSSLSVYALLLSGWSSNGKFSLLGALRAASQLISYEIAMGLSVVAIFLVAGSFRLTDIVANQGAIPWHWNVVRLPLAFLLFFISLFAETNRLPFDLPEGESELVAGYHTEYSSMSFALFFMGEYAHIVVGSLIVTMLFFAGWHIPFVTSDMLHVSAPYVLELIWLGTALMMTIGGFFLLLHYKRRRGFWGDRRDLESLVFGVPLLVSGGLLGVAYLLPDHIFIPHWVSNVTVFVLQLGVVLIKTLVFSMVFIWVRWTLPRFRYDQLMRLGWKTMIPLGLLNIVGTGVALLVKHG